jgi:hypothetical protein
LVFLMPSKMKWKKILFYQDRRKIEFWHYYED